jgi:hypothetical protein
MIAALEKAACDRIEREARRARAAALEAADPCALPRIAASLSRLADVLADVTG